MEQEHDTDKSGSWYALRQRAELVLQDKKRRRCASSPVLEPGDLLYELEVHEVELELQNDALRTAQIELAESRDRYRDFWERAPVGYLTLDASGRIREANLTAAQLLGVDRACLVERPLASFMRAPDADAFCRHLAGAFASSTPQVCDVALESREGPSPQTTPVRIDSIAVPGSTGDRAECRCTVIDLSERKQVEEELREVKLRFHQIAGHIDDVLMIHERGSCRMAYVSPAFESLFGRPVSDRYATGSVWLDCIHPDDRTRVAAAYRRMLDAGDRLDEEHRICRPDGEVRWVRIRSFPIVEEDGSVHRDVGVVHDITRERELEGELRQAQKMEAIGAFASGVAHDFNNVLQAILGCIYVASDKQCPRELAGEYLSRAADAAKRGGRLAAQLMAFARKQPSDPGPIEVDVMIDNLATLIERLVTEQVFVEIELGAPEQAIFAEAFQLEQILMNLAANARDAMPEGGTLSIRTRSVAAHDAAVRRHGLDRTKRYVRITVGDSGVGMDERTQERIFDPYFTTKKSGRGTGLGLATVFAVTQQLGGHIEVESEPGRGTKFRLYFPCCGHTAGVSSARPHEDVRFSGTVLLVEDGPLIRMTVRHYLEELGFDVLEARNAEEAQALCDRHGKPVDLLISDVILPVMRGPRLLALLRQRYPDLRALFISANAECFVAAAPTIDQVPVLPKPFNKKDLVEHLEVVLDGEGGSRRPRSPAASAGLPE